MRFFAQPVSITARPRPRRTSTNVISQMNTLASVAEAEHRRLSRVTCREWYQRICPAAAEPGVAEPVAPKQRSYRRREGGLTAIRADEREEPVEIQRFLEKSVGVHVGR